MLLGNEQLMTHTMFNVLIHDCWKGERPALKDLIRDLDGRLLMVVGVTSGADARLLQHGVYDLYDRNAVPDYIGGFVLFVSGYLCAAAQGLPDMGYVLRPEIARQTDVIEQVAWMAALDLGRPALPVGVDVDTGYGNEPSSMILTCRQVHKQGAQYVQIEDQRDINKSCGHMAGAKGNGKTLVSTREMIEKRLRPAVSYARCQNDLLVMARTDAVAVEGFDAAVARARAYAETGADMVFIEAPDTEEQLRQIPERFQDMPALTVANMIEGSPKTPYKSPREVHEMGFDVALYPIGLFLAGHAAMKSYCGRLAAGQNPMDDADLVTGDGFAAVNKVLGREQTERWNNLFHKAQPD